MKNPTKGNLNFSYSSTSPSFLSKIKSCFRTHKSSRRSSSPLLSNTHNGDQKKTSYPSTIPSKPVSHDNKGPTTPSSYPSTIPSKTKPSSYPSTIPSKPVSHDNGQTTPSSYPSTIPSKTTPSSYPSTKPVSHDKGNTTPSTSSPTIPNKPADPRDKTNTTSSSSSPTIPKKPVSQPTVPPEASKQNTDPTMVEATLTLAKVAGKLAFFIGKKAAQLTTGVVKSGIEIAHNQIEHIEKLKETFACYYTEQNGTAYQGTLNFSNNQIIFSTDHPSHTTNENRNPPILPPGSSYKTKESELKLELKISFREVIEINQVNAENPSTRYIQIRGVQGSNYAFGGFVDYYKAYNHIYSLLPTTSS